MGPLPRLVVFCSAQQLCFPAEFARLELLRAGPPEPTELHSLGGYGFPPNAWLCAHRGSLSRFQALHAKDPGWLQDQKRQPKSVLRHYLRVKVAALPLPVAWQARHRQPGWLALPGGSSFQRYCPARSSVFLSQRIMAAIPLHYSCNN